MNPRLEIYRMLKEKNLLKREYPEYKAIIKEEERSKEFKNWYDNLPPEEKKDFDYAFLTNY